jgi:mRNA export factor
VSGGADKAGRMFDITTGQSTQVAQHDEPIKCAKFLDQGNVLATGSWDKTIKYWDLRSPTPIGTVQLPERCYAMDTKGPLLVAATAEKYVCVFDLNNPTAIFKVKKKDDVVLILFNVILFLLATDISIKMANTYCFLLY